MAGETQFALSIRPPCCDGPSLSQNLKKCCNNTAAQNTARARNTDGRISCTTRRAPSTWVSAVTLRIQGEQDAQRVRRATNRETPRVAVCRDMVRRENNQPTRDKTAAGIPHAMFMTRYQCLSACSHCAASRPPCMVANVHMHSITSTSNWPAKRHPASHM